MPHYTVNQIYFVKSCMSRRLGCKIEVTGQLLNKLYYYTESNEPGSDENSDIHVKLSRTRSFLSPWTHLWSYPGQGCLYSYVTLCRFHYVGCWALINLLNK